MATPLFVPKGCIPKRLNAHPDEVVVEPSDLDLYYFFVNNFSVVSEFLTVKVCRGN